MKYKIAVCISVFLAGIIAGWVVNARLLPEASRDSAKTPPDGTFQSRMLHTNYTNAPFQPREYIKINWSLQEDGLPGRP
ncbi:hypothetical protein [Paenibacillus sp. YN15]|uniref:hypothetical protein n=1 Tax=Paenibacillus sp. YN15 TaxID=1742774 RepID=UPI000DCC8525|nr:hypothetical protein [Paenibacillus sp. YN15]RAV01281.1 hypothetical protein DQG13_12960 [Paenibacillus sp. YN15]